MTALVLAELSGADLAAVLVSVGAAVAVGALLVAVLVLVRAGRKLSAAARALEAEQAALVHELRVAVADTEVEVERLDALLGAAESITTTVDSASKLAYRAVSNPVIKTVAFASGTSRAAKRLRNTKNGENGE